MGERGDDVTRHTLPACGQKARQSFISREICTSLQQGISSGGQKQNIADRETFTFKRRVVVAGLASVSVQCIFSFPSFSQAYICSAAPWSGQYKKVIVARQCIISIILAIIRNISSFITRFHFVFDHTRPHRSIVISRFNWLFDLKAPS